MTCMTVTGFYKSSEASGGCTQCSCDVQGSIANTTCDSESGQCHDVKGSIANTTCDSESGHCQCLQADSGVGGLRCDSCLSGYWKREQTAARLLCDTGSMI